MKRPVMLFALVSAVAFGGFASSSVSAATNEEIARSLLDAASQALGVEITDPDLIEELTDGLEYAIEDGSIPQETVDEIDDSIDSGTDPDEVIDDIEVNMIDQIANWEEYAPEFRENFERVRAEFKACREASSNASECARGVGFKMQVAFAEDAQERIIMLKAQLITGGVELTQEELDAIDAEIAELEAKIARAQAKLATLDDSDPAVQEAKNTMARVRQALDEQEETTGTPGQDSPSHSSGASAGKGNSSSGGNSNGNGNSNAGGNSGGNGKESGGSGGKENSNAGGNGKGKP